MNSELKPQRSRSAIAARDWLVAVSGALTLAFSAWGLGGVQTWTLHVLFAGGLTTLVLALCPLPKRELGTKNQEPRTTATQGASANARRLATFPFFWLSSLFLLWLLLGALNPAAAVFGDPSRWWVEAIPPRWPVWMPTSVASDYQPMNAWRVLVAFAASFFLVWGLWAGLTRRKPVLLVLWILLLSGSAMGLVGIMQHLSDAKEVLWTFPSNNHAFWGSFFYRNQGAAYLNLILLLSGALFFYHATKSRMRLRSGGPHFLCFFLFLSTAASIALALSRGGILFGLILSLGFVLLVAAQSIRDVFETRAYLLVLFTAVAVGFASFAAFKYVDFDAIAERFGNVEETVQGSSAQNRVLTTKVTWEMAEARLVQGWGAGSFRYIFPMYQRNHPELFYWYIHPERGPRGRYVYRYAHNDIVQFVAEYGLIGAGLIFGAILSLLVQLVHNRGIHLFAVCMILLGILQAFGHAFIDFIFNSPAYWMAFVAILAASTKLLQLDAKRTGARSI